MGMISELFVKLGFKADEFNRGIDGAKQKTDFFSDGLKKIGGAIAGAFAVGEILNFAKEAVIGYDQAQQAATRLLTALHGNKDVQESLIKQAEKLKTKTLFDDDETVAAQAKLAMLVREESKIKQLIPLIQDFATAQQMDLVSAAQMVGKAVSASAMALQKMGFEVTGTAGSAERFASVVQVLNDRVGGQAEAAAKVGIGSLKLLALQWDDVKKKAGGVLVENSWGKWFIQQQSDILTILSSSLTAWGKFKMIFNPFSGAKDTRKLVEKEEQVDKYSDNLNKFDNTEFLFGWKQSALKNSEIYSLRLKELKAAAKDAEQSMRFPEAKADINALAKAWEEATKAVDDFVKANKTRDKTSTVDMMGKDPFNYGRFPQTSYEDQTNVINGKFVTKTSGTPGLDMAGIEKSLKAGKELFKKLDEEYISPVEEFNTKLNDTIKQGMVDALTTFGEGLGQLFTGDMNIGEFGASLLDKCFKCRNKYI